MSKWFISNVICNFVEELVEEIEKCDGTDLMIMGGEVITLGLIVGSAFISSGILRNRKRMRNND